MASNLLSIPAELLASIADDLEVKDYCSLRLCCEQVEDFTFPYFARKFFSRKKFFRAHSSLTTALSISESRISPYLETFVLSTELLDKDPPSDSSNVSKEAYLQAYAEQTSILASGWDRDMLIAALENLPSLKTIAVEDFDDGENWDFDGSQMNSENDGGYGLKSLLRSLGFEPGRPLLQSAPTYHWVSSVQTLLTAVAKASVRPKILRINGKRRHLNYNHVGVDDDAFNIPSFMQSMLLPVIEGLEELDLYVHNRYIYPALDNGFCRTSHLRKFLGWPTRLQKLRIRHLTGGISTMDPTKHGDEFWAWIGADHKGKKNALLAGGQQEADGSGSGSSGANALRSPPPVAFPHLRELELGSEEVPLEDLTRLLKKVSPTLRKISLCDVSLRRAEEATAEADEVKIEVDLWASLCEKLAGLSCDGLYEVNFSGFGGLGSWILQQFSDLTGQPDTVHFKVLRITGADVYTANAEFSYKGPDVKKVLRQLADDLRAAIRDGRHIFNAEPSQRRYSF